MRNITFESAREMLLARTVSVESETLPLDACADRVLAENVIAPLNVPPFDRSPYDGYAFRAIDVQTASQETPVTLRVLEEIAAGDVSHVPVTEGTAVRIMTGAPIPEGADAVVMYEKTSFTDQAVTLFAPAKSGQNIVRAGEDVRAGTVLVEAGSVIDAGTLGTFASQGLSSLSVFRKPRVGIISTGSELVEPGGVPEEGKIYNSNRYTFEALVAQVGCEPVFLGSAADSTGEIADLIRTSAETCDAIITTGGVSVGDFDLTPAAMEACGAQILFRGVDIKPGMACCYGVIGRVLVCGLSGNPASALTNYYAVALPAIKKLCGRARCLPEEVLATVPNGFGKKSPTTRLLRGTLDLSAGEVRMVLPSDQGNVVLSSAIGCNVMTVVPAGSGPVEPGAKLKGFMLQ